LLQAQGKLAEAEALFREGLSAARRSLRAGHQLTLAMTYRLGDVLRRRGQLDEAENLARGAVREYRRNPDRNQGDAARAFATLIQVLTDAGKSRECAAELQTDLEGKRKALAADDPGLAGVLSWTGYLMLHARAWAEAEPILRECLAIREKVFPDGH